MNDQTILRTSHDADNPYVVVNKNVFEDSILSWKAKGIMGYLLSRPNDWCVRLGDLANRSPQGKSAVRSAIRELEQHGYLTRQRTKDDKGRYNGIEILVHERPVIPEHRTYTPPQTKKPQDENPHVDNPPMENQTVLSIDLVPSTNDTKKTPGGDSLDALFSGTDETPSQKPAEKRLAEMRKRIGSDVLSVAAHTAQVQDQVRAQGKDPGWTIPYYRDLSPQCSVIKEATGVRPKPAIRHIIDETVPNDHDALERLHRVCEAWVLTGWSPINIGGMLDFYSRGELPSTKPKEVSQKPVPRDATPKQKQQIAAALARMRPADATA